MLRSRVCSLFTWKVGMVESINIIIDERRKRELTMTKT